MGRRGNVPELRVVVDTREKTPYTFQGITPPPPVVTGTLPAGDYSLEGHESHIAIERKSLIDAYGTFGRGRERFERELERLSQLMFGAVVIEADWATILRHPPTRSRMNPKAFFGSVVAWQIRYGVHFIPCPNRQFGEKITFRMLERFWKDQYEKS